MPHKVKYSENVVVSSVQRGRVKERVSSLMVGRVLSRRLFGAWSIDFPDGNGGEEDHLGSRKDATKAQSHGHSQHSQEMMGIFM